MDDLDRFECLTFMGSGAFEHFNVRKMKFYQTMSWWLSTRVYEIVENMKSAVDSVQRSWREVHAGVSGLSAWRKRKCVEAGKGYLARDGVYLFP